MGTCMSHTGQPAHGLDDQPQPMVIRVNSCKKHPPSGLNGQVDARAAATLTASTPSIHIQLEETPKQQPSPSSHSRAALDHDASAFAGHDKSTRLVGSGGSGSGSGTRSLPSATSTQSDSDINQPISKVSTIKKSTIRNNHAMPSFSQVESIKQLPNHHSAPAAADVNSTSTTIAITEPHSSPLPQPNARTSVDLFTLLPDSSPRRRGPQDSLSINSSPLPREPTPTVQTTHIESGVTDDGFFHINQYIVEMGRWRREKLKRRQDRALRRAECQAERERQEAEDGINHEALECGHEDDHDDEEEDDEEEYEHNLEDEEDEEATILGRGSYGVVKKVFNTQDGRFYAMKIMSKALLGKGRAFGRQAGEVDGVDSIFREIAILKKLDSPFIIKLVEVMFDEAEEDDNVYLIMEFAENGCVMHVDLDDGEVEFEDGSVNIVTEPLPVETARRYFRDVLSGLEYLHHQKVIHRDIKPENLLVGADGHVKIADFGVSTLCEGDECLIASTAGTGVFMSPEMVKSKAKNRGFGGAQTDIWSLGVTLFMMLYGRLPWYARSIPEIYRMICEDPLVFPQGLEFAHIPVEAQCLIRSMLDKNPKTRATIAEMLQCVWVTDNHTWDVQQNCALAGFPDATQYKTQPLVESTVCSGEIQAAMRPGKFSVDPVAPSPPAVDDKGDRVVGTLCRIRSRLALWRKEMCRKCDAKKAERARKRATVTGAESAQIEAALKSRKATKASRRATAAEGIYAPNTNT